LKIKFLPKEEPPELEMSGAEKMQEMLDVIVNNWFAKCSMGFPEYEGKERDEVLDIIYKKIRECDEMVICSLITFYIRCKFPWSLKRDKEF
jgi:hypothetical protein